MGLTNLALHKLESYRTMDGYYLNSFFIKRDYCNYLLFPPYHVELYKDIFLSKGGVGRQLITNPGQLNFGCEKTFNTFGASAVLFKTEQARDVSTEQLKVLKVDFWGEDFFDKDIIFTPFNESSLNWFRLLHQGKYFLITDEKLIAHHQGWKQNKTNPLTEEEKNFLREFPIDKDFKIDYLIPRCHDGEFYLQKLTQQSIVENINIFLNSKG